MIGPEHQKKLSLLKNLLFILSLSNKIIKAKELEAMNDDYVLKILVKSEVNFNILYYFFYLD